MKRAEMMGWLTRSVHWDMVVIGGGATGLGVAVDAASRGFRTLLVEAHDFAKGTSSRSTKLVHGGVRYLEQGDIPLVLEALRERGILHRNAPHLVHHLSFVVPRYKWWEGPFYGVGLKMYDALAGKLNLARSRSLSREETLQRIPNVESEHLLGGTEYFDGQFDDARLAITLARTATYNGATVLNYMRAVNLIKERDMVTGVRLEDVHDGLQFNVKARVVVNAAGIFADEIRGMDEATSAKVVQPSQGIHLVFDRSFLPGDSAIMVPHTDDGRVLFVIPWHDKVLVGTTDTALDDAALEPRPLEEEIEFVLRNAARYLAKDPTRADVRAMFAGQRPLVRPLGKDGAPTKSISRNHEILISPSGLVTIVGGKWTTYRKMAEDTVDRAQQLGGLQEVKCRTESLRLFGWRDPSEPALPEHLMGYGVAVERLQRYEHEMPELAKPLHPDFPHTLSMVRYAIRHEWAQTVEDILARRVRLLFLDAKAAAASAPKVAEMLGKEHDLPKSVLKKQVEEFEELASGYG